MAINSQIQYKFKYKIQYKFFLQGLSTVRFNIVHGLAENILVDLMLHPPSLIRTYALIKHVTIYVTNDKIHMKMIKNNKLMEYLK